MTYGLTAQSGLQARDIRFENGKSLFSVFKGEQNLGSILLNIGGQHNILNAMAGIATGLELNIPFNIIKKALEEIKGVKRRLEIKGEAKGITVMDDYGHHPTEIMATLTAVKESYPDKRLLVVFQPHRYTRTQGLFQEFTRAFYQSDILVVLPIYPASEAPIPGVDSEQLLKGLRPRAQRGKLCS